MKLEFSNEQVQVLYELINKTQITGAGAKTIVGLQTVIEEAASKDNSTLTPEEDNKKSK